MGSSLALEVSVSTCYYCGRTVEFRHIDGMRRPIDVDGGGWCSAYSESGSDPSPRADVLIYPHSSRDFCHPTRCKKCNAWVYFIRHNGGSVWVDELGWPWPKHPCYDHDSAGYGVLEAFSKRLPPAGAGADSLFGLVVRSCILADAQSSHTMLAITCPEGVRICVALRGRYAHLNGVLVLLHFNEYERSPDRLEDEQGQTLPVVNWRLDASLLSLPDGWCHLPTMTARGKSRQQLASVEQPRTQRKEKSGPRGWAVRRDAWELYDPGSA